MVILDSNFLFLFFHPNINSSEPDNDDNVERISVLINSLHSNGIKIGIPTPVLSEILVCSGPDKQRIVGTISSTTKFKILPFNQAAAVEVALLTDGDLLLNRKITAPETKVKVKYDRQIIAIAKVNGIETIYSNDIGLGKTAIANQINVIKISQLPLLLGQINLPLPIPSAESANDNSLINEEAVEVAIPNAADAAEPPPENALEINPDEFIELATSNLLANSTLAIEVKQAV